MSWRSAERAGGVLWAETDLAEAFGLGNVKGIPPQISQDGALVATISHPIVEGLQGKLVACQVPASGVIAGFQRDIFSPTSNVMPLLVQFDRAELGRRGTVIVYVFCGVRRYGTGIVVFRPTKIDTTSDAGRRFEERLLKFSLETADQPNRGR